MALIDFIQITIMICIILVLTTGVFLLYKTIKTKLFNLLGLSLFFILYGLQFLGEFIFPYAIRAFYSQFCLFFLILFVKATFYKESKHIFPYFMIISFLILKIFDFYFRFWYNFQLPLLISISGDQISLYYVFVIITMLEVSPPLVWLSSKALVTYTNLKKYEIEPWVKMRYLLVAISGLFLAISGVLTIFMPIEGGYESVPPIVTIFIAVSFIIFSVGNLIAWVMPRKLKNYFNRGYTPISDEKLSESELLENIRKQLTGGEK